MIDGMITIPKSTVEIKLSTKNIKMPMTPIQISKNVSNMFYTPRFRISHECCPGLPRRKTPTRNAMVTGRVRMYKKPLTVGIKMNTLTDGSRQHVADMMIQGTVMGITSLKTTASKAECTDEEICSLMKELIDVEEKFEKKLKTYL